MIEQKHPKLSVRKQCELLDVNRNRLTPPKPRISEEDEVIMKVMDQLYLAHPHYGTRNYREQLQKRGYGIGRGRIRLPQSKRRQNQHGW